MNTELIIAILTAVLGSSGLWSCILAIVLKKMDRNKADRDLLMGLAHDRIIFLCEAYIKRGYITTDEFENLYDYLYKPYEANKGNGTAKRLMDEVKKLPIRKGDQK